MKKNVLFTMLLIGSTLLTGLFAAAPQVDPAAYATRLNYKLTSKWAYTNTLGNYNSSADLLGAANSTRGMTVKNGKMLFCTRNTTGNQIIVVLARNSSAKLVRFIVGRVILLFPDKLVKVDI